MLLVKCTRIDHSCHTHTGIEGSPRERDEFVKVRTKQDIVTRPFLLEASLNLDSKTTGAIVKVFPTRLPFFRAWCIQNADQHAATKVFRIYFMRMPRVIESTRLHMKSIRAYIHFQMRHTWWLGRWSMFGVTFFPMNAWALCSIPVTCMLCGCAEKPCRPSTRRSNWSS